MPKYSEIFCSVYDKKMFLILGNRSEGRRWHPTNCRKYKSWSGHEVKT